MPKKVTSGSSTSSRTKRASKSSRGKSKKTMSTIRGYHTVYRLNFGGLNIRINTFNTSTPYMVIGDRLSMREATELKEFLLQEGFESKRRKSASGYHRVYIEPRGETRKILQKLADISGHLAMIEHGGRGQYDTAENIGRMRREAREEMKEAREEAKRKLEQLGKEEWVARLEQKFRHEVIQLH